VPCSEARGGLHAQCDVGVMMTRRKERTHDVGLLGDACVLRSVNEEAPR
jgi:hypothetical protein